jgi:hypothetical protein
VLSLTASPSHSSRQVLSIAPAPPPASQGISHPGKLPATLLPGLGPTPASQGPTHRQLRHDQLVCRRYADRHTFLRAVSAVVSGSTVTIYGHRGFEKCGGPDDISFGQHTRLATFTLASGANIGAVVIGRQRDRRITAKALPDYLRHTQFGFFRYTGPPTAITRLIELYHP